MQQIRILVNGAHGKMGQLTVNTLSKHADFNVVGETGRGYDLATAIKNSTPDVVIDFTSAEVVLENTKTIIDCGARPVIGTSGLLAKNVADLQELCVKKKLGGIIAPNFSVGAVLVMKHAQEIAKYFPEVEIIEMHHRDKLDSPSGTAVRTAELLAQARTSIPNAPKLRETVAGARGANYQNIPIHAVRLPGFVAHQQIIFGSMGETLTLRHDSIDRQAFMPGVILACKKVLELKSLVYGLENIL